MTSKDIQNFFSGKTVALVGPANNLINRNKGAHLDSFDIVARLNDSYIINEKQYVDYGSRCDVLVNSCNCELLCVMKRFKEYLSSCQLVINPTSHTHQSDYVNTGKSVFENYLDINLGIPFYQVEEKHASLVNRLGLNTGMCALSFLSSLDINLHVFGFSFHGLKDPKYHIDSSRVSSYDTYLFDSQKVHTCKTDCPPRSPCRVRVDERYAFIHNEQKQLDYFTSHFLNKKNITIDETIQESLS